jgi:2Fe-2S ferredoxin
MPTVHLITHDGQSHTLDVAAGTPLMQAATAAGVPGIVGECGGSAMCATCHVYVDEAWIDRLPAPLANEEEMLECTASERQPGSRLSCQVRIEPALDGLVVRLPERQQ